jgi:hypothetical protein
MQNINECSGKNLRHNGNIEKYTRSVAKGYTQK